MSRLIPFLFLLAAVQCHHAVAASGGKWDLLLPNIGIAALHMQLLHNNRVVIFDRTDFGLSNISLPDGKCRVDDNGVKDCTAHSVEYDVETNTIRPLMVLTDVWCSSGAIMPDGQLVQTGGFKNGSFVIRTFNPCNGSYCDWEEIKDALTRHRWYATNQILSDGRQIIIGGRREFNYEFYPKDGSARSYYNLSFLRQTYDPHVENNLYPFVFLNVDGNLFIFANNKSILFDYINKKVVKSYPDIPDGDPRNYPSTGSAVLLPLKNLHGDTVEAEVMVCGGAPKGAFMSAKNRTFVQALDTCGRMKITDPTPQWVMEKMPLPRVMGDMLLLPNGNVLIINGGSSGTAGWELGRDPVLHPIMYHPDNTNGSRFDIQNPTIIPRMYHSTAILLADGRVLVGGSDPHQFYKFKDTLFPTELRLEAYSPSYLDPSASYLRPTIISPVNQTVLGYGQSTPIRFAVSGRVNKDLIKVTMVKPSFNTHSFSMHQRLLDLGSGDFKIVGNYKYQVRVSTPGSGNIAPSGFYMLFLVHQDIPSPAIWVQLK